jgi:hypothetical protein
MRRYNIVPLILLILSVNFALAAPALMPENKKLRVDVVHVPKDVIAALGKRGDELEKMLKLSESFDKWWGGNRGSSSVVRPPSSSAPSESGHGSMQVHVPPANPVSSTESDRDPESSVLHPPTTSTASSSESNSEHKSMPSLESASDLDREAMGVDHGAPPPNPESLIVSGLSHTLPSSQVA